MKRTALVLGGILSLGLVATTFAQTTTNVYSKNAVGYISLSLTNEFTLLCIPLEKTAGMPLAIDDVFPYMKDNTVLYLFNPSTDRYREFTYYEGFGWYEGELPGGTNTLARGVGFWLRLKNTTTNLSVVGEVPSSGSSSTTTVSIASGFSIVAYPFPVARLLSQTEIGKNATDNDVVYVWNGKGYTEYTYYNTYGWYEGENPADPMLYPGTSFWYSNKGSQRSADEPKPYVWP
jgi:hypothetical protein